MSLFFVIAAIFASVSASARSLFPLECGVYEIGGLAKIHRDQPEVVFTVAKNSLSETTLRIAWHADESKSYDGNFWIHSKLRLSRRISPYLLEGEFLADPELRSASNARTLRSFFLIKKEEPCSAK